MWNARQVGLYCLLDISFLTTHCVTRKPSSLKMKILTYSDLHLEFGSGWTLPPEADGDVMILAGDIMTLKDYRPLDRLLRYGKTPFVCHGKP